jgi:hypothetical protein
MSIGKTGQLWHCDWALNGNTYGINSEAGGLVSVTTPANPLGGRYMEMAASGDARVQPRDDYNAADGATWAAPDNTKRWGRRWWRLWRKNQNPDTYDGSSDYLRQWSGSEWTMGVDTAGHAVCHVAYASPFVSETRTMATALANDTDYAWEVWRIYKDSSGTDLTNQHWIFRVYTLSAGNPATVVDEVNLYLPASTNPGTLVRLGTMKGPFTGFGGNTGMKSWGSHHYSAWEDADNPLGVIRIEILHPSSAGNYNDLTNDYTYWDETPPDDTTTMRQKNSASTLVTYKGTDKLAATGIGASDSVAYVQVIRRNCTTAEGKGATGTCATMIYKGGAETLTDYVTELSNNTWSSYSYAFLKQPDGTSAWTQASLSNLEVGVALQRNGQVTHQQTAMLALVAYQASGETIPALSAPDRVSLPFTRSPIRNFLVTR